MSDLQVAISMWIAKHNQELGYVSHQCKTSQQMLSPRLVGELTTSATTQISGGANYKCYNVKTQISVGTS